MNKKCLKCYHYPVEERKRTCMGWYKGNKVTFEDTLKHCPKCDLTFIDDKDLKARLKFIDFIHDKSEIYKYTTDYTPEKSYITYPNKYKVVVDRSSQVYPSDESFRIKISVAYLYGNGIRYSDVGNMIYDLITDTRSLTKVGLLFEEGHIICFSNDIAENVLGFIYNLPENIEEAKF